jgi:hypothetical protein
VTIFHLGTDKGAPRMIRERRMDNTLCQGEDGGYISMFGKGGNQRVSKVLLPENDQREEGVVHL